MSPKLLEVIQVLERHIRLLQGDVTRLENVLKQLERVGATPTIFPKPAAAHATLEFSGQVSTSHKPQKRQRKKPLDEAKANDISTKIVNAAKARSYIGGASRTHIVDYLTANGYDLGRSYSDVQLSSLIGKLIGSQLAKTGAKSKTRYHCATALEAAAQAESESTAAT